MLSRLDAPAGVYSGSEVNGSFGRLGLAAGNVAARQSMRAEQAVGEQIEQRCPAFPHAHNLESVASAHRLECTPAIEDPQCSRGRPPPVV